MAENTTIEWATHTFNPWIGCAKIHVGCQNCYAEAMAGRLGVMWGPHGTRRRTAESTWRQVEKWNRKAECDCAADPRDEHWPGCPQRDRPRVFPSLCDPFEDWHGPIFDSHGDKLYVCTTGQYAGNIGDFPSGRLATMNDVRRDFFALIDSCQNLDWLLLTKRPWNVRRMWCSHVNTDGKPPSRLHRKNCWLIYSASDQSSLEDGFGHLRACSDLAQVLGMSLEPLTGPVNFAAAKLHLCHDVDWVIVGGESGPRARPCRPEWIRSIVKQCDAAGVPCFVKQLGANVVTRNDEVEDQFNILDTGWPDPHVEHDIHGHRENYQGADCRIRLRDSKGGDPDEWPEDLRVREFPRPR